MKWRLRTVGNRFLFSSKSWRGGKLSAEPDAAESLEWAETFTLYGFFCPGDLQHVLTSSQQGMPSLQHFCTAAQQPLFSAQHFRPFSQQPSRAVASEQALFSLQQASLAAQQSLGFSSVTTPPASNRPRARKEPANKFVNMENSPVNVDGKYQRSLRTP
jgi:hypothetical protein